MKIDSLSEKLILYFVLLGIGAIMVVSTVSFYSAKEALMSRTFDQLTSLRIVKKKQIEQFYSDRVREIRLMAELETLTPGLTNRLLGQHFSSYYILENDKILAHGYLGDTSGSTLPVIPVQILTKIREQLEGKSVVIFDMALDKQQGSPYQLMAATIPGEGKAIKTTCNILILAVSVEAVNAIMLNNDPLSGLGLSGETYLVGDDFLMRSASRFQPNSILQTKVKSQSVVDAVNGRKGSITTNDYRIIPVLSSFDMIEVPGLKWAILSEIDVKEAMVPIYETRTRILLLSAIMIVIFFVIVFLISRQITKPLNKLRNATVNLGKGVYSLDLPVDSQDEIGALTASFNTMARQIKEKTTELQMERFGRMRSVFDGEEMERQRLSRELHDGIGQSLIAIKLRLENLLYQDGKDITGSIHELKNYFDQIIDEVRRISNNLMPSVLEVFSIPIAFRNLFSETEEHSNLRIHFEAKGDFDDLNKKIKTYIYRLTQEALNNIVKHAESNEVWVHLTRDTDQLRLIIRDNGKGFSPETLGAEVGNGIHNMRERASLLQGQITIHSIPLKGTTITLDVPIITNYVKNQDFPRG